MFDHYSTLEILAGDVCFVNLFRSILPVVPTECDVLRRQHNHKEWKFKEQHAKMWENINIAGAIRYSRRRGFNIAAASAPAVPTPLAHVLKTVGRASTFVPGVGEGPVPVCTSTDRTIRRSQP